MELLQFVTERIKEVLRPLSEEVATIKILLASVTIPLERVDLCASHESAKKEVSMVVDVEEVAEMTSNVGDEVIVDKAQDESSVVREDCVFGSFSPRAKSCPSPRPDVSVAPVMLIMPEQQEICGEPSPQSMVHLKEDSTGTFVASTPPIVEPSQSLDMANEEGVLAPNSEDLFGRELCSLLVSLEAVSYGSSKKIAHLLTEKSATGKIKKVKEYLRRIKRRVSLQGASLPLLDG
jgi:hypothetical protein